MRHPPINKQPVLHEFEFWHKKSCNNYGITYKNY